MKSLFITLILLINITSFAQEAGMNIEHDATWQQILDKAKKENKFILLDAYASWCGPCKWMAKEVFPLKEVGEAINPYFVNAKIDMEKGEGIELAKKYNVRSYPTYLFFDSNGNLVHRGLGSMPAEDFIKLCKSALDPNQQYITLREKYLSGNKDTAFLRQFSMVAADAQDSLYKSAMMEYLDAVNYTLSNENIFYIINLTSNLNDESFKIIQKNKIVFENVYGQKNLDEFIENLVWNEAKRVGKKGEDKVAFRKVIAQYLPGKEDILSAEYDLSLLKRAGNWSAYLPKAEKFANEFAKDDWERLNDIANNFLENYSTKSALQKGLKISLRSVEVMPNFINLLTTAQIHEKLKDNTNAKKYAALSLEKAKDIPEAKAEVEEFIKSLK